MSTSLPASAAAAAAWRALMWGMPRPSKAAGWLASHRAASMPGPSDRKSQSGPVSELKANDRPAASTRTARVSTGWSVRANRQRWSPTATSEEASITVHSKGSARSGDRTVMASSMARVSAVPYTGTPERGWK